jgi:hypothetical protein
MAQNIDIRSARRTLGVIGAAACLVAVGMVSVSGQAFARAGGGGGGGHAGGGHAGGGHMEAGRGGFGHGGYGHGGYGHGGYGRGGYGHGGFYRNGRHYYYGDDGVVVEDCCYAAPVYAAPVYVAPPLPVVVAPFGIFVR